MPTLPSMDTPEFWGLVLFGAFALFGAFHLVLAISIVALSGGRKR